MIELIELSHRYPGSASPVFEGLELFIESQELIFLSGDNGAGKSTLLKIMSTLLAPTSGDCRIAGFSAARSPREVRRQLAWASGSDGGFFPRLTGVENLSFFAAMLGLAGQRADARVRRLLEVFDLEEAARLPTFQLTSGMRQRLGLARSLLGDAPVVLWDEPTRSLDPNQIERLQSALDRELADKTIVMAVHEGSSPCRGRRPGRHLLLREGRLHEAHPVTSVAREMRS